MADSFHLYEYSCPLSVRTRSSVCMSVCRCVGPSAAANRHQIDDRRPLVDRATQTDVTQVSAAPAPPPPPARNRRNRRPLPRIPGAVSPPRAAAGMTLCHGAPAVCPALPCAPCAPPDALHLAPPTPPGTNKQDRHALVTGTGRGGRGRINDMRDWMGHFLAMVTHIDGL